MSSHPSSLRSSRAKALLIVILVIALAVFNWVAPTQHVILHNVLHHLNILPFMLAGMFFGWRGAVKLSSWLRCCRARPFTVIGFKRRSMRRIRWWK